MPPPSGYVCAEIATTLIAQLNDHGTLVQRMVLARLARYYHHEAGQWKGRVAVDNGVSQEAHNNRGRLGRHELHYAGLAELMAGLLPPHAMACNPAADMPAPSGEG